MKTRSGSFGQGMALNFFASSLTLCQSKENLVTRTALAVLKT